MLAQTNTKINKGRRYRSANGESRPYKDGSRYKLSKSITFPDGTTKKIVGSGNTRTQCEINTAALIKKRLAEHTGTQKTETVLDACQHWLSGVRSLQPLRPKTGTAYQHAISNRIGPSIGGISLVELKREHIQRMYSDLTAAGHSYHVLKDVRVVLNGTMKEAFLSNKINIDPTYGVKLPPKPKSKPIFFTLEETRQILLTAANRQELATWLLALQLGLRQGERLGLTWDNLDLDSSNPTLTVTKTLSRVTGKGLQLSEPKTESSARVIPLTAEIVAVLKEHRKNQLEAKLRNGSKFQSFIHVFTTPVGGPIDPANDRKAWMKLLEASGVAYRKLHAARHTTATLMHENGVDLLSISHVLGHSSLNTTAAFYAHVPNGTKLKAVSTLGNALGGAI